MQRKLTKWHSAIEDPPTLYNHELFVFCPEKGNDDEGYGNVIVGKRSLFDGWTDVNGQEIKVSQWAYIEVPDHPLAHTLTKPRSS